MSNQTTPRPWKTGNCHPVPRDLTFWHADVLTKHGTLRVARVAGVGKEQAEANAKLIVRAVNAHETLLEAVQDAYEFLGTRESLSAEATQLWDKLWKAIAKAESPN